MVWTITVLRLGVTQLNRDVPPKYMNCRVTPKNRGVIFTPRSPLKNMDYGQ